MTERIRVLILEDHLVTLDGLRSGLSAQSDLQVCGACSDSDEGLTMARALRPDIILLDLHLPGKSGPKTMVKQFCDLPDSKVLIFSGESRPAFIQAVLSAGACGYLLKSESVTRVADAMREIVAGKKPIISAAIASGQTKLTKSEQEVLKLLARGMKYQDMAEERLTSPATVRKQCELLLLKLGLKTREELIAWAVQNGYGNLDSEP
ncbi:MAG: response regulator transcription factor [Candidatus Obscuribacterales bacterium]|nr:response regulator transcription factor [Candidatus Obscuribacterales bacterium]